MKIRIRDHKLRLKQKTKKFRPLRLKNTLLKLVIGALIVSNLVFIELACPGFFTTAWF